MTTPKDRCWHQIGVWSPEGQTCPELSRYVHCQNCPVFQEVGNSLMDRSLPDGWLEERTESVSRPLVSTGETRAVVLIRLGAERYGLPAAALDEVSAMVPIQPLPHRAGRSLLGLINHRGWLIPCLSLADLLGAERVGGGGRLVVLSAEGGRLACPVDEVLGLRRLVVAELLPPPGTLEAAGYTDRVAVDSAGGISLLSAERLLVELERRIGA